MKKYGYSSVIGSSIVVRDSKPTNNENEIGTIVEENNNLVFVNGYLNKDKVLYHVNIHKEFCIDDNFNIDHCISELLKENTDVKKAEKLELSYTD